jgi:hypothetical protein
VDANPLEDVVVLSQPDQHLQLTVINSEIRYSRT